MGRPGGFGNLQFTRDITGKAEYLGPIPLSRSHY
jgi:hypothetical protein